MTPGAISTGAAASQKMHVVGTLCANGIPERLSGEAVVIARNDPPIDVVRRGHLGERLPPDPIGRRFGVEEIAGEQHMAGPLVPRGGRQAVDRGVARFHQAAADVFGVVPEPSPEVQVRGVDEAKPGHASATPRPVWKDPSSAAEIRLRRGETKSIPSTPFCTHATFSKATSKR